LTAEAASLDALAMPKPLPPSTVEALSPPPGTANPYTFFDNVSQHPFQPNDAALNLRNAWWLMDAAFLSYCPLDRIEPAFDASGIHAKVQTFRGPSTQCYVAAAEDWIVLAFRGTQVDDFWSSVIDWAVDARFVPQLDAHGHWVHSGFLTATQEVWPAVEKCIRTEQAKKPRPLWITGHSLGAALATVAASLCSYDQAGFRLTGLYTYGSPRVGDRNFGKSLKAPAWRFRHNSDLVTHVPLGLVFRHVGNLEFIDGSGHFYKDVDESQEMLLGAASLNLSAGTADNLQNILRLAGSGAVLPGFLADHAPVNYATRIWNCYEVLGP
jgi:triacylglycerol lipase